MIFEGSIITEQGVTFGIVVVKPYALNNHAEAERLTQLIRGSWASSR